jgi:diacylglycerol kinase family enzyme
MASGRRLRVVLRIEQRAHRIRACTLVVTPNPIDDTSEHFRGRSCLDGGTLAVYLVRSLGPLALLRLALRWLGGHWREDPLIQEYRTRRCAILARARTLKVTNDGEVQSMTPPLCYRIHPRALRVVVPRDPPSETR